MLSIDSSGGGQVFRNSLGLSALLKKDVKIMNIRAFRPKPGLQRQHLACIKFLEAACNAKVLGARLDSKEVSFSPADFLGGGFSVNIGSAGSTCLILQSVLLPSMLKETRLRVDGGTDVPFAPPSNYFSNALFPILKKMHASFELKVLSRGYYPKGNGNIVFSSRPAKKLLAIDLPSRKEITQIKVFCHSRGLPEGISRTMSSTAQKLLDFLGKDINVFFDVSSSNESTGCGIEIFGAAKNTVVSASALGEKGVRSEAVAKKAVERFLDEINSSAGVDVHTSDQLVPFMALAQGKSSFSCRVLSHHLLSSIRVCEELLGIKFEIKEKNGLFFVSVEGSNFFLEKFLGEYPKEL